MFEGFWKFIKTTNPYRWLEKFFKKQPVKTSYSCGLLGDGTIYIGINPSGFGHSSRGLGLVKELNPDKVLFASSGGPLKRIRDAGYSALEVGPEIEFVGKDGKFSVALTALKNADLPARVIEQINYEVELMRQHNVSVVVSDCRAATVLAAAKLGLPCIFMTNQTDIDCFFENSDSFGEKIISGALMTLGHIVMRASIRDVNEIIIADFPTDDAVCLPILSNRPEIVSKTERVGPITTFRASDVKPIQRSNDKPYWVITLGGQKFRQKLFYSGIKAALDLPDTDFDIIGVSPEMLEDAKKEGLVPQDVFLSERDGLKQVQALPNLRLLQFVPNPQDYYDGAEGVITQAGHSTVMELITIGKQSILVPDMKQVEQENNARRMAELGCSSVITYDQLGDEDGNLYDGALANLVLEHRQTLRFKNNCARLAALREKHDGAKNAAAIVKKYVDRMTKQCGKKCHKDREQNR